MPGDNGRMMHHDTFREGTRWRDRRETIADLVRHPENVLDPKPGSAVAQRTDPQDPVATGKFLPQVLDCRWKSSPVVTENHKVAPLQFAGIRLAGRPSEMAGKERDRCRARLSCVGRHTASPVVS